MGTVTHVSPVLQIIQKYFYENKQNVSDLDYDSETEYNKISKVTSIENNTGLYSAIKCLTLFKSGWTFI